MGTKRFGATAFVALAALGLLAFGGRLWERASARDQGAPVRPVRELWQCPMHPQIVRDHPGFCPICHMRLERMAVPGDAGGGAAPARTPEEPSPRRVLKYRNPMDPTVFSDHPMKDSMGMDYIPVYAQPDRGPGEAGGGRGGSAGAPDRAAFTLSQTGERLIGVRTARAGIVPLVRTVGMAGRVVGPHEVSAELLEIDAGSLKAGTPAEIQGPGGAPLWATVVSVGRREDDLTRAFGVRLEVRGAAPWMLPGVFVEVSARCALGRALAVPSEAVLDTGTRRLVFVTDGRGRFDPRPVVVGRRGDGFSEILSGVAPGERVVTSAQFLVDSESQFQAALDAYTAGSGARP